MSDTEKLIATAALSAVGGLAVGITLMLVKERLESVRLGWAVSHQFAFGIDDVNHIIALTRSILIGNNGRVPAEDVEIVLAFVPPHFQIFPQREHSVIPLQHGVAIRFPNVGAKQQFSLEMLAVGQTRQVELPLIIAVRSKAGDARAVAVAPQRVLSLKVRLPFIALEAIGAMVVIYAVVRVGIWLAHRL